MAADRVDRIDCSRVVERDLAGRYVAGRLDPDEAWSFEAHYFECDDCWARVERATEIRAAFAAEASEHGEGEPGGPGDRAGRAGDPGPAGPELGRARRWLRWGVPAAAAALLATVLLRGGGDAPGPRPDGQTLRGGATVVSVVSSVRGESAVASWEPVDDAELYRVRLHAADGTLVLTREVSDTSMAIPADSLPPGESFWRVDALDALREVVGRSRLVPVER